MRTIWILLLMFFILSCGNSKTNQLTENKKMKLTVLSNYGENEKTVSDSATIEQVNSTMQTLDWKEFHQVVLEQENGDWIEVGGNLSEDGLSAMYEESGDQYVINQPPSSVKHMTEILSSYLHGDNKYRENNKFE
jgi:hypothetical protein